MLGIRTSAAALALSLLLQAGGAMAGVQAQAKDAPLVRLWRLDCGLFVTKHLVNGCYLIRHGDQYLLWDAGFGAELVGRPAERPAGKVNELKEGLAPQLAALGLKTEDVAILAISHVHWDHIGQADTFPKATLLVGEADWKVISADAPDSEIEPYRLKPWISDGAPKKLVSGDEDVFGDGSVVMLATPGHTPGHHSLLVRLKQHGPVLLTGDLFYSADQRARNFVPASNTRPAETLASFGRFNTLARQLDATVIIQHEPDDVAKLPPFPEPAD